MSETCPNCHVGHLQAVHTVLVRFMAKRWCMCRVSPPTNATSAARRFSTRTLRRVDLLIGESGPPPNRHVPAPAPPDTSPADSDVDTPAAPQPRPK
jgi:hypothetical protein